MIKKKKKKKFVEEKTSFFYYKKKCLINWMRDRWLSSRIMWCILEEMWIMKTDRVIRKRKKCQDVGFFFFFGLFVCMFCEHIFLFSELNRRALEEAWIWCVRNTRHAPKSIQKDGKEIIVCVFYLIFFLQIYFASKVKK